MVSGAISGVFKSPPFSPHSAWSQGCQYISTFLVFQKSDQICLSASKLLGKSLPWIRKCRNRFIVGCRGKCGVRWYQVPHCSVHGQPRANPECSRAIEALKEAFFFLFCYSLMVCDFFEFSPCWTGCCTLLLSPQNKEESQSHIRKCLIDMNR